MFCPNCGNNCGDANFCSNCGHDLKGPVVAVPTVNHATDKRTEMMRRYGQYMPNRLEAIRVLRQDTGMGPVEAMHVIDDLFGEEEQSKLPETFDMEQLSRHSGKKNDCRETRGCSSCGTKLQQTAVPAAQSSEWKVGIPCPNCGGTKLDGGCCAFCGAQLVLNATINVDNEEDSFVLPRIYNTLGDSIDLEENSFIYRKRPLFSKKYHAHEIMYAQIEAVTYFRKDKDQNGVIIEYNAEGLQKLEISPYRNTEILYQLFCYLKTVAPSSVVFKVDEQYLSSDVEDKWRRRFDTEIFFNMYNPYQKRARKKIQELTGLPTREACSIAAKVICERQNELYSVNPSMAIRDLNRAIREHECEVERERKEREERCRARSGY